MQIPSYWTCFNHTVKRWYPVANLTSHRQATLYESYAPGKNIIENVDFGIFNFFNDII